MTSHILTCGQKDHLGPCGRGSSEDPLLLGWWVGNFSRYVTTFIMSILQKDIHILPLGSYHEYFSSRC